MREISKTINNIIPNKAFIEPSFKSILLAFKYSSIAKKETSEKIKILEAEKKNFQHTINEIRVLWNNTLSTRNLHKLDSAQKKELMLYQYEWDDTMHSIDFIEKQVKETTNDLLKAFQGNESGELQHNYAMIKQVGFHLSSDDEKGFVPEVVPGHLFYLLNLFCLLSSYAMNAVKIQYRVIALFENISQSMKELFRKELNPVSDQVSNLESLLKDIKQVQEKSQRESAVQGVSLASKLDIVESKVDKRNRAGKCKPLKLTTCLTAIQEVYDDSKYNYRQQFDLHPFAIRNTLSDWKQYLDTNGEKGKPPLPKFDFYRHTDKEMFKKWVRDIFFPDYRERSHKDALAKASHPENMDYISGSDEQDFINAVDESLANNDHNNNDRYK